MAYDTRISLHAVDAAYDREDAAAKLHVVLEVAPVAFPGEELVDRRRRHVVVVVQDRI